MAELSENNIQWYTGDNTVTASFTQKRFVNKIRKYAQDKQEVNIVAQNRDGSICVRFPLNWLKVSPPRQMSDEQKAKLSERLSKYRKNGEKLNE